jgi:cell division protein FtsB
MNRTDLVYWLTWINLACWGVCFWWMRRISTRQDSFLNQLKSQGRRIETLSKAEHDLIKEVHPQVGELIEGMQEVVDSVREKTDEKPSSARK